MNQLKIIKVRRVFPEKVTFRRRPKDWWELPSQSRAYMCKDLGGNSDTFEELEEERAWKH